MPLHLPTKLITEIKEPLEGNTVGFKTVTAEIDVILDCDNVLFFADFGAHTGIIMPGGETFRIATPFAEVERLLAEHDGEE